MPLLHGAAILPVRRWQARPVAEAIARWGGAYLMTIATHLFDLLALDESVDPLLGPVRLFTTGTGEEIFERAERRFGFRVARGCSCSEVRLRREGLP